MERTSRNNYWSCQHRGLQACLEGPGQAPLSIKHFLFLDHQHKFTALFFSAHSTSTAHIGWRWAVLLFVDQTFRFRFRVTLRVRKLLHFMLNLLHYDLMFHFASRVFTFLVKVTFCAINFVSSHLNLLLPPPLPTITTSPTLFFLCVFFRPTIMNKSLGTLLRFWSVFQFT